MSQKAVLMKTFLQFSCGAPWEENGSRQTCSDPGEQAYASVSICRNIQDHVALLLHLHLVLGFFLEGLIGGFQGQLVDH